MYFKQDKGFKVVQKFIIYRKNCKSCSFFFFFFLNKQKKERNPREELMQFQ